MVAGVLPHLDHGAGVPTSNLAYTGDASATTLLDRDSAEAGGLMDSFIGNFTVSGQVNSTGDSSVVAAAGEIGRTSVRFGAAGLVTREYDDPFGPPTLIDAFAQSDQEIRLIFSEGINSASFILSVDADNDGDVTGLPDTQGSITLNGAAGIIDENNTLLYDTTVDASGNELGVLRILKADGFPDGILQVEISGDTTGGPAVYDRSGGRSILRDVNLDGVPAGLETAFGGDAPTRTDQDLFGTIFDGDGDGIEGGQGDETEVFGDVSDTFVEALNAPIDIAVDGGGVSLGNTFENSTDVDVFSFEASDTQFVSFDLRSNTLVRAALFFQDTQGTESLTDDSFELVAKYENGSSIFQAAELAENGNYFVAVAPVFEDVAGTTFTLDLTLASSDTNLVNQLGGSLPLGEEIGYVSNFIGENQNFLGANAPRQLVYVNVDGGSSTETALRTVEIEALDAATLDPTLEGRTDTLINGGLSVIGMMDNLNTIFTTIPDSLGVSLNTQTFTAADLTALGGDIDNLPEGLTFTTTNPADFGFDPDAEFTTLFVGVTSLDGEGDDGLLGLADGIDLLNIEKSNESIVFVENFAGMSDRASATGKLNDYSRLLANIVAHELGHNLGLNHQPTNFVDFLLNEDDPDNNPATPSDANRGPGLMAYSPTDVLLGELLELGTGPLAADEFPIGNIDTVDMLLRALT